MYIPLGLGYWPKKIPYSILLLCVVILSFSFLKFPDVHSFQEDIKNYADKNSLNTLKKKIVRDTCDSTYAMVDCAVIDRIETIAQDRDFKPHNLGEFLKVSAFTMQFNGHSSAWPDSAKTHELYPMFTQSEQQFLQFKKETAKAKGLLVKESITLPNLLAADFSHFSYSHLLGNLFFLLVFGLHLEMAFGSVLTFLTFMFGGIFGLLVEVFFLPSGVILLGSSAGVSAVIGAYVVTFWQARMKFLFSMVVYNKSFYLPIALTVPVFYILTDIIGVATRGSGLSSVAHLAHVGGLVTGVVAALMFRLTSNVRWPFLFEQELSIYEDSKETEDATERVDKLLSIRRWNFQNYVVCHKTIDFINAHRPSLTEDQQIQLSKWIESTLHFYLLKKDKAATIYFLEKVQESFDLKTHLSGVLWHKILAIADECLEQEKYQLAKDLYEIVLEREPRKLDVEGVRKTCENIDQHLIGDVGEQNVG